MHAHVLSGRDEKDAVRFFFGFLGHFFRLLFDGFILLLHKTFRLGDAFALQRHRRAGRDQQQRRREQETQEFFAEPHLFPPYFLDHLLIYCNRNIL